MGGWTDEETGGAVAGRKRGWGCGQMTAPTHLKAGGIDFILLEARGPIGKDAGDFGIEGPTSVPTVSNPPSGPKSCLPLGTFLAPSFSAFFLASPKSSAWPMLAWGTEAESPGQSGGRKKRVRRMSAPPRRAQAEGVQMEGLQT